MPHNWTKHKTKDDEKCMWKILAEKKLHLKWKWTLDDIWTNWNEEKKTKMNSFDAVKSILDQIDGNEIFVEFDDIFERMTISNRISMKFNRIEHFDILSTLFSTVFLVI